MTLVESLHLRVRYVESDQMGVAHHSAYVAWLEQGRIEWLRTRGLRYRDLEEAGILLPVVELNLRYRRSVRFDDDLDLTTTVALPGPSRVVFTTVISSEGVERATGVVTLATVNREGRPIRLPAHVVAVFR